VGRVSALFLVLAAFVAGLVSFSSPCCLPLLPGYVAYVGGDPGHASPRRTMAAAGLFVLGFGATFTAMGASASWIGATVLGNRPLLVQVAGLLIAAMGVATVLGAGLPGLARERRLVALHRVPRGPAFAAPLGSAFALGWTPCIGPVLAGLLTTAAGSRTAAVGAALLAVYAAGLGVPFLLLAWAVARGRAGIGIFRRHHRLFAWAGGALLMVIGLAMTLGFWARLFAPLVGLFSRSGWPPI
jgi:cytochrome c-type biogenesis protein